MKSKAVFRSRRRLHSIVLRFVLVYIGAVLMLEVAVLISGRALPVIGLVGLATVPGLCTWPLTRPWPLFKRVPLIAAVLGGAFLLFAWPGHARRATLEGVSQLELGMHRDRVELLFEDFERNPRKLSGVMFRANDEARLVFAHPDRMPLQGYEHIRIEFDEQQRVSEFKLTLDP